MTRRLVVVLLGWLYAVVGGRDLVLAKPADKAGVPDAGRTTLAKDSTAARRPARPGIERFTAERNRMIEQQLISRGIRDPLVIGAMRSVPRHLFVPTGLVNEAYDDNPLPIGHEQTISQPYIVAFMTEALGLTGGEKVLEVGTGSGYQAAVLAEIVDQVYTIEIVESLGEIAGDRLERLHYNNVHVRIGDGYRGWPEEAPFDAIIVTAAPDHIPKPLIDQLAIGGRLVLPVGDRSQELIRVTRTPTGIEKKSILPVRFVPMTGEARDN